jgi:hypothetical protein
MKRLLVFLTFLAMSGVAHAGDPTTELLEAPRVGGFITLSVGPGTDGKAIVKYTVDNDIAQRAVNGLTFRSDGQIGIHIQNFNPLTQTWVIEAKATPDVSFEAIQAFLNDLKTLQAALPQPQTPLGTLTVVPGTITENCATLASLTQEAYDALQKPELTVGVLHDRVAAANGYLGVKTASAGFVADQASIEMNIDIARMALAKIRTAYSVLQNHPSLQCSQITGQLLVDYVEVRSTADKIIAAKEALRQQLGELVKTLQPYLDQNAWQGPALTDYVIKTITPTFAEQQNLSVTAKMRTITLKDGSIVVTTDDANIITGMFVVRKNTFFVAERAVAVIYNNLKYPQYGTAVNAQGSMVVKRTMDHQPINGALMLNLVMRLGSPSVAYPFLQFGVSSAKDIPGFLAGVGLRFAAPFNFSISAGGMITRYKDLDGNLKVGDTVTGTDDINKHLAYKTSPVVLYGAMQLKF